MGIASSVLEAVDKELQLYPGHRAAKVGLRIGEFAGVDTESLRFCFEAIVKDSRLGRGARYRVAHRRAMNWIWRIWNWKRWHNEEVRV